jgi:Protein of unknown function (DUF2924)
MDASLQRELERLRQAPIAEIRRKYRELFAEEPRSRHKQSLFRHVAWRMQAHAEGGLSERARQRAYSLADEADLRVLPPREALEPIPMAPVRRRAASDDRRIPSPCIRGSHEPKEGELQTGEGRKKRELNASKREGNAKITLNLALFFQEAEWACGW